MKKIIKLTESELVNIIKRVLIEQEEDGQLTKDLVGEHIVFFNDPQETKALPEAEITSANQYGGQINLTLKFVTGKESQIYFDCKSESFYKKGLSNTTQQPTTSSPTSTTNVESDKLLGKVSASKVEPQQTAAGGAKVLMTKTFSNKIYHSDFMNLLKNEYCTLSKGGTWVPKTKVFNR